MHTHVLQAHVPATILLFSQDTEGKGSGGAEQEQVQPILIGFLLCSGFLTVHSCWQRSVQMGLCQSGEHSPELAQPLSFQLRAHPTPGRTYTNNLCSRIHGTVYKHQAFLDLTWTRIIEATSSSGVGGEAGSVPSRPWATSLRPALQHR